MTSNSTPNPLAEVAEQFSLHRPKLFAIAYRTMGSPWAADDVVQETWIRLQRTDIAAIDNLEAWLTTVTSRVCIDLIRRDAARREDLRWATSGEDFLSEAASTENAMAEAASAEQPEDTALLRDDLAAALNIVLDTLGPLERLALVLHDFFALAFDDIAPIVDRSPATARQLASRARARLRDVDVAGVHHRQESAILAFLSAARDGDFGRLLQLLDPEIELRSDPAAVGLAGAGAEFGAPLLDRGVAGPDAVARVFNGRAQATRLVYIDGIPAAAYVTDDNPQAIYLFRFWHDRVSSVEVLADADFLAALDIVV
ncbi:sigma-70 family RNA polymerase sigma factor [Brevibacterium zhoupengii]|uniref:sigma-70 family RNA polymerase sigma factor n=1 Tax=Brevibacterium zhoupengii TaxID=2898795 RepID=UPI001F09BC96|nr:sigma-70 family RNA polymerase sigma factor [Brevibacterium zhoupengii]